MKRETKIVEKEALNKVLNILKESVSVFLSDFYYYLLLYRMEDNSLEENLALVDEIELLKEDLFKGVLGSYNDFIKDKNLIDAELSKETQTRKIVIERMDYEIKKTGIITIALTIILPTLAPITLIINLPKMGLDAALKNISKEIIDSIKVVRENYNTFQKEFYEFVDLLRTDYHHSKRQLQEVRKKMIAKEDVTDDLIKIVNPELLGLPIQEFQIEFPEEIREEPKQLTI